MGMEQGRIQKGAGERDEGLRAPSTEEEGKTMVIPQYVKVGPYIIRIEQHDGYWNKDDIRVYGEFDERTSTISLDTDASSDVMRETMLHEVLHVILGMYDKDDEGLVRLLSPMLLQVLRDNPKFVLALTT
jgi:hypothetical protein